MFKCGDIAVESESGNHADAGVCGHGVLANGFAFVNIADVHLDYREVATGECVAQGEAGVGEGAGVDDQAEDFGIREFADLINDEAFVVGLVELHFHAKVGGLLGNEIFEIGERLIAVDGWLAFAEPI